MTWETLNQCFTKHRLKIKRELKNGIKCKNDVIPAKVQLDQEAVHGPKRIGQKVWAEKYGRKVWAEKYGRKVWVEKDEIGKDEIEKDEIMDRLVIGILAHVDAGKTTLSEALLYRSGSIRKMGRVDNGDTFLDTDDMERKRGITIFARQAIFPLKDRMVTLLDTPGHVDFSAEMERTLQVLDHAVLVISGADGVQGHTRTLWNLLERHGIPVFLFINKMDQPGTDKEALLQELKSSLGDGCVDFGGMDCKEEERAAWLEDVAVHEEQAMDTYLETGDLPDAKIADLIGERKIFPCFFGAALKMEGVDALLHGLYRFARVPVYGEDFGARVFKITRDAQGNRLTHVKITGGSLKARMPLGEEKVNQIRLYSGDKYQTTEEAEAGTVCAVTGWSKTMPGDGIGAETETSAPMLEPVLTCRMILPEGVDAAGILPGLRQLEEEEPELHLVWNEALQEIQVRVMGEVQTEVLAGILRERMGLEVGFDTGNIVYKETISQAVEGVGHFEPLRHYAEVHLWMEPGERGSGLVFAADCSEDLLDRNWQRLVLTHLMEREHRGVLTGSGLTDMKITLVAGKAHIKHTEGGDFRQATYRALRQGLMETECQLLEPYYEFRLEIPEKMVGRAMSDLERMLGSFVLEQGLGDGAVLTGTAPVAAMRDYQKEVAAYSRGYGRLLCTVCGYRPCHNQEEVIRMSGYEAERDMEYPSGSVFCSHGAGVTVPWDQVKEHMHLPLRQERQSPEEEQEAYRGVRSLEEPVWIGVDEVDEILERASHANSRDKERRRNGIPGKRRREMSQETYPAVKRIWKKEARESYLLVDGYNIIFAWEELKQLAETNIEGARGRLMDLLCNYQGLKGCHLILVFDAYRVQRHETEILDYHNIHVVYTKEAETADQFIEKFAFQKAKEADVTVATSDHVEQIITRGHGCGLLSARELQEEIRRVSLLAQEEYQRRQPVERTYLTDVLADPGVLDLKPES